MTIEQNLADAVVNLETIAAMYLAKLAEVDARFTDIGIGTPTSPISTDLDAIAESGFVTHGDLAVGAPIEGADGRVLTMVGTQGERSQLDVLASGLMSFRDKDAPEIDYGDWQFLLSGPTRPARSLGGVGYQMFPSGLLIQFGTVSAAHDDFVAFPIAFPFSPSAIMLTDFQQDATNRVAYSDRTTSGFVLESINVSTGAPSAAHVISYLAIGY